MPRSALRIALIGAFGLTYLWMAHEAATAVHPNALVVVTGFMPLASMLLAWAWQTRARWFVLAALAAVFALLHTFAAPLISRIVWVYFLQDASCNLFAAGVFASSLRPSAEPLCTRLARMARGNMTPLVAAYTRCITFAWVLFFATCTLVSATLFLSGHLAAWSWFANVLNLPLVGAMFVAEYLVRLWVVPESERSGVMETIRSVAAYWQHENAQKDFKPGSAGDKP